MLILTHQIPEINAHLRALERRFNGNLAPLNAAIGALLLSSTQQRFVDKRDPEGNPWAPLTLATILRKGKSDILVEHGAMMHGLSFIARDFGVSIGTNQVYGIFHQEGTEQAPQRAFLGISEQDEYDLRELINDYFLGDHRGLAR